ncbi:MAG: replication-associated recombination protein A, partial [Planctomycetes bacterium]|nr:replication-associated recombination protein A [Planctomycetota bacterium]
LLDRAGQDARSCLNALEALLLREQARGGIGKGRVEAADVEAAFSGGKLRYDRSGEDHFNVMSAFHKSMRVGDPQAAIYWLTRMLVSGEDPLWVARRIVRFASEDVGLADPQALAIALAARESYRQLGSPEGELALAQAAVYMALAPKSNALYRAYGELRAEIGRGPLGEVPMHLRNAATGMMKSLGYGRDYQYPHDMDEAIADQHYLPEG